MHIEAELDDAHAERLLQLQQRLNKPLSEIVANIMIKAIDDMSSPAETEGQKILRLLEEHSLLGCIEGDGNLSVDYKKHLWGNE